HQDREEREREGPASGQVAQRVEVRVDDAELGELAVVARREDRTLHEDRDDGGAEEREREPPADGQRARAEGVAHGGALAQRAGARRRSPAGARPSKSTGSRAGAALHTPTG